jgi:hypothetical protein
VLEFIDITDEINKIEVFQTRIAFMSWKSKPNSKELRSYLLKLSIIALIFVEIMEYSNQFDQTPN